MENFQQLAIKYKGYQKNFKVEVARFEELDEVYADIKLKQLLWNCSQDWDIVFNRWMQVSFLSKKASNHNFMYYPSFSFCYFYLSL